MIDFAEHNIGALLVSSLPNVRYLSGFTGSNAMVLLQPDALTLITDPRYDLQARTEALNSKLPAKVVVTRKRLWETALHIIQRQRLRQVGFEQSQLTYESFQSLQKSLPRGHSLVPLGPLIDTIRMIKTSDEIARIRRSVDTNSAAFEDVLKKLRPGITELGIAAELEYRMRKRGAEGTAFETIVASGPRTALPHANPTSRRIGPNELLLIDMGASQDGYMSDMTRMVFFGAPTKTLRGMYRSVWQAQQAAIDSVRDGAVARNVDRSARDVLKKADLDKAFVHSTGHGLGLEIHEAPRIGRKDRTRLKAGMVITIEPGAYVEGVGGIRIEDTVLVTKNGCEVLTPTSKELMVL